jgi:hypothetical protein
VSVCPPTRLGPHVAEQPEAYRRAVEALTRATATKGKPWSCVGGEVDLIADDHSASLTVVDADGNTTTRMVASPEDVEPLGEALLAKPLAPPPAPPKVAPKPVSPQHETMGIEPKKTAKPPPRVFVSAAAGPRYAGRANLLWGSATVAGTLPPSPWGGSLWLRFDGISYPLDEKASLMRAASFGASVLRGFVAGPLELRAAAGPSFAVIRRDGGNDAGSGGGPGHMPASAALFDFRLGVEGKLVFPIISILRGVTTIDAELSPLELFNTTSVPSGPNGFPTYTVGFEVGFEVAIP